MLSEQNKYLKNNVEGSKIILLTNSSKKYENYTCSVL